MNYKKLIENAEHQKAKGNKSKAIYFYREAEKAAIQECEKQIDILSNQIADDITDESLFPNLSEL